ncbi:MAG: hypothetical protein QGI86_21705 [Candidatus Poribacteria bacterium]|nr:hypothetical protein [Candidatus Poribacteria bacterium]MDP6749287.1 hypothetical protein [Candidatus Poribacteria bacterium]MDP6962211.1 hypothetical protein [Dehalococcoidia bacterium]
MANGSERYARWHLEFKGQERAHDVYSNHFTICRTFIDFKGELINAGKAGSRCINEIGCLTRQLTVLWRIHNNIALAITISISSYQGNFSGQSGELHPLFTALASR